MDIKVIRQTADLELVEIAEHTITKGLLMKNQTEVTIPTQYAVRRRGSTDMQAPFSTLDAALAHLESQQHHLDTYED